MKKSLVIIRLLSLLALLVPAAILTACDNNPPKPTSTGSLTFSPLKLPEAAAGQPYQVTITVSGNRTPVGRMGIESGSLLPAGLELQYQQIQNTASIIGTPQKAGSYKFTVGAWCMGTNSPGQEGSQQYELLVK